METQTNKLIQEGKVLFLEKKFIDAFFCFEKAHQELDPEERKNLEVDLVNSAYRSIWSAYADKRYELMEYLARVVIQFSEKKISKNIIEEPSKQTQQTNSQIFIEIEEEELESKYLQLAKTYNGLALALYQLGRQTTYYNKKASQCYEFLLSRSFQSSCDVSSDNSSDDFSSHSHSKDSNTKKKTHQEKKHKEWAKSKIKNDFGWIIHLGLEGCFEEAKSLAFSTLEQAQAFGFFLESAQAKKVLGNLLFHFKEYKESFFYLLSALELLKTKETKSAFHQRVQLCLLIAENYFKLQDFEKGKPFLEEAYPLFEHLKEESYLYYALLGQYQDHKKDFCSALESYLKAIRILNCIKWDLQVASNVDSFLRYKNKEDLYLLTIERLIQEKREKEERQALEILENLRSKLFLEGMRGDSSKKEIPFSLKKERDELLSKLHLEYSKSLVQEEKVRLLEEELYAWNERIARIHKSSIREYEVPNLSLLSVYQQNIPIDGRVLSYFYTDSQFYVFILGRESFRCIAKDFDRKELETTLEKYLELIQRDYREKNWELIENFYHHKLEEVIFSPLLKEELRNEANRSQEGIKNLILIPYKILHSFPLHSIVFEWRYDLFVSYLPNLEALRFLKSQNLTFEKALLLGDPSENLPSARKEASMIAELFSESRVLLGREAKKSTLFEEISKYPLLHYSGHVYYNAKKPLYSYLECAKTNSDSIDPILGNESYLFLKELYRLDCERVEFLSLSGCSSGKARRYRGEEELGFVRSFFYAGVRSILASLWDIEDSSSRDFLVCFFEETKKAKGDKKIGFRESYRKMKEQYSHPFFYSAFSLYEGF